MERERTSIYMKKNGSGFDKFIVFILVVAIVSMIIEYFMAGVERYFPVFMIFVSSANVFVLFRPWYKKNSVYWSKRGVNLNFPDSFKWPKSINFNDIREVYKEDDQLVIKRFMSETLKINVAHFDTQDVQKFIHILKERSEERLKNYGDSQYISH